MEDGEVGGAPRCPAKASDERGWLRVVDKVKRQFDEAKARGQKQKEQESPADKAARVTAGATKAIAWLTGAVVLIAGLQLYEIIQGSKDTTAIADAAKRQVCAANRSADAAQKFADTAVLINGNVNDAVGKLDQQAKASQDMAGAAKISAQIAQTALQPAVAVRVVTREVTDASLRYTLTFRNEGGSLARISAKYCFALNASPNLAATLDKCTSPIWSESFTVLPHTEYPAVVHMSPETGIPDIPAVISGTEWLFIPVEITYPVFGKPHTERSCFTYRPAFKMIGDCDSPADQQSQNPN